MLREPPQTQTHRKNNKVIATKKNPADMIGRHPKTLHVDALQHAPLRIIFVANNLQHFFTLQNIFISSFEQ